MTLLQSQYGASCPVFGLERRIRPQKHLPTTPLPPKQDKTESKLDSKQHRINYLQNIYSGYLVNKDGCFCPVFCKKSAFLGQKKPILPLKSPLCKSCGRKPVLLAAEPSQKPQSRRVFPLYGMRFKPGSSPK